MDDTFKKMVREKAEEILNKKLTLISNQDIKNFALICFDYMTVRLNKESNDEIPKDGMLRCIIGMIATLSSNLNMQAIEAYETDDEKSLLQIEAKLKMLYILAAV